MVDTPNWEIFFLTLPDLNPQSSNFYYLIFHYPYAKLTELGEEYLVAIFLIAESIYEVTQYEFDMENLTVTPKHIKLPKMTETPLV